MATADPPRPGPARRRVLAVLRRVLARCAALAGGGACLGTAIACAARLGWPFELASHFPLQYAAALVPATLCLALERRYVLALVCGAALILNGLALAPYLPARGATTAAGPALRVLIANVHSGNRRCEAVLELIDREAPDVVLLLEINDAWKRALEPLAERYPHRIVEPRADNFGIGLYSRRPFDGARAIVAGAAGVPTIEATLRLEEGALTLLGTHPPPPISREYHGWRDEQLVVLARRVRAAAGAVVLAGDLNATPWSPCFVDLCREAGLQDSGLGRGLHATWPTTLSVLGIPIDHCLHTSDVEILARRIGPPIGSDHRPLIVDLRLRGADAK